MLKLAAVIALCLLVNACGVIPFPPFNDDKLVRASADKPPFPTAPSAPINGDKPGFGSTGSSGVNGDKPSWSR